MILITSNTTTLLIGRDKLNLIPERLKLAFIFKKIENNHTFSRMIKRMANKQQETDDQEYLSDL